MNRGHIRKRGNAWNIQAYVGKDKLGREHRISKTVRGTEKDAKRALTDLLADADKGLISTDRSTVAEFLERWLKEQALPNVEPTTYKRYEELVRIHIVPNIGTIKLGRLDPYHLQALYSAVQKTNCPRTALKVHRLMFQSLKHAMRWRIIPANAAALAEPPKVAAPIPFIPSPGDVQRVLAVAEGLHTGTMVYLAILTGLRQGELLGLRWRDVDLENGRLHVQRSAQWLPGRGTIFKTPKTRRSIRVVPLTEETVIRLRAHRVRQTEERLAHGRKWKDQDLVFPGRLGEPMAPSWVKSNWKRIRLRAHVPEMRFHDLRHAHATILLEMGVHPKVVSDRLGHSGIQVTMDTYSHVIDGVQAAAIKGLDRVVAG